MTTTMTDDEIKTIAQQVVERLLPAIEEAVRQQARYSALFDLMRPMIQQEVPRQAQRPAPRRRMDSLSKVVRIVTRTAHYAGQDRYGQLCAQGLMPRSYLLKLSRLTADECRAAVDQAIAAGQIEKAYDPDTGLACVRALKPAQTPAQPAPPAERDYGPLDDPAQDAHEWDFATALAKARERDSWY